MAHAPPDRVLWEVSSCCAATKRLRNLYLELCLHFTSLLIRFQERLKIWVCHGEANYGLRFCASFLRVWEQGWTTISGSLLSKVVLT